MVALSPRFHWLRQKRIVITPDARMHSQTLASDQAYVVPPHSMPSRNVVIAARRRIPPSGSKAARRSFRLISDDGAALFLKKIRTIPKATPPHGRLIQKLESNQCAEL